MNFDFGKLCGKHIAIYEAYYKQMDVNGSGTIEAMTAAQFLKKSGLSDVVLSRVWDLADPKGNGYLDKSGFYVALKLVSLAQAGHVYNMKNIYMEMEKPPKLGELPKLFPPRVLISGISIGEWSINVMDRLKYEQLFESLKPVGGMLTGHKVKGVLMESNLPMETLGKIWDLADQDKDGNLDKHEFIVAMHLVYQTLQKRTVPDALPAELRKMKESSTGGGPPSKPTPPVISLPMCKGPSSETYSKGAFIANFPKDIAPPPMPLPITVPPMARVPPLGGPPTVAPLISTDPLIPIGAPPSVIGNADWVVTESDLKRFEIMFRDSDRDKDGLVSGLEVKNIFLQSGVGQKVLAHIWALCDTHQSGKLTLEQFALAMWLVECKQKGVDPPQVLTANMVPPSMRAIIAGVDLQPQEQKSTYSNPELEMISKEIEELAQERRVLETEIAQKEADIRIKSGEVRSLQSELDTLSATLKQLEHQRGEAQKRLEDLKTQVNKIREQCQKQEETINEQESELNSKRDELQKLKDEENSLQKEYDSNSRELQKLTNHLQNTQLQISSIRSMLTQLLETQRQMTDALLMCKAAIDADNIELVSEYQLQIEPGFNEARKILEKQIDGIQSDPFNDKISVDANAEDALVNDFKNDTFSNQFVNNKHVVSNGFVNSFETNSGFGKEFDAFGTSSRFTLTTNGTDKDPFAGGAFGSTKLCAIISETGKDDFGSDPFAVLHAPTGQGQILSPNVSSSLSTVKSGPPPRPESPSPALPPKKSKVPPPRPAPPKPSQTPSRSSNPNIDAFASTSNSAGFADFADFDNKAVIMPSPSPSQLHIVPAKGGNLSITKSSIITTTTITTISTPNTSTTYNRTTTALSSSMTSLSPNNLLNNFNFANAAINSSKRSNNPPECVKYTKSDDFVNFVNLNTNLSKYNLLTASNPNLNSKPHSAHSDQSSVVASIPLSYCTLNNTLNNKTTSSCSVSMQPTTCYSASNSLSFLAFGSDADTPNADKFSTMKSTSSIITGPTDFNDDPFKDYRYEDPFNIKDPFVDNDGNNNLLEDSDTVFKHDLISEDEQSKNDAANYLEAHSIDLIKSKLPDVTNVILDMQLKFDNFSLKPSIAPCVKTTIVIPSTITNQRNVAANELPDNPNNFANFDNFNNFIESSSSRQLTNSINNTNGNAFPSSNFLLSADDCSLDAFNDHFIKPNTNINSANSNVTRCDAFGIKAQDDRVDITGIRKAASDIETFKNSETTHSFEGSEDDHLSLRQQKLSAIENNFEDDFFELNNNESNYDRQEIHKTNSISKHCNDGLKTTNIKKLNEFENNDEFLNNNLATTTITSSKIAEVHLNNTQNNTLIESIKTKAPKCLIKVQNQTLLTKISNINKVDAAIGKVSAKYADDYSLPENFESDLQDAISRSMAYK